MKYANNKNISMFVSCQIHQHTKALYIQGSYRSPEKKFHSLSIAFQFYSIGMKLNASVFY